MTIISFHYICCFKQKYEQTKRKVVEVKRTQLMTNTGQHFIIFMIHLWLCLRHPFPLTKFKYGFAFSDANKLRPEH
jgi:hypothetical protein